MHVQMNVADKKAFFAEIANRLSPGARLATFEVCRRGPDNPAVPLPWSMDGTDSYLATPSDLRAAIEHSGFETIEWADETPWITRWFQDLRARSAAAGTAPTLSALLTDGPTRMTNYVGALAHGALTVHRGAFERAS
jgi:sarcosine/dimethylglycine N-methyltransferase